MREPDRSVRLDFIVSANGIQKGDLPQGLNKFKGIKVSSATVRAQTGFWGNVGTTYFRGTLNEIEDSAFNVRLASNARNVLSHGFLRLKGKTYF